MVMMTQTIFHILLAISLIQAVPLKPASINANSGIFFKQIGQMSQSVSYCHLHFNLKIQPYLTIIDELHEIVTNSEVKSPYSLHSVDSIMADIQLETTIFFEPARSVTSVYDHRPKRQLLVGLGLGLLAGSIFGLYNGEEISALKDNQDQIVHKVDEMDKRMVVLEENMKIVSTTLTEMSKLPDAISRLSLKIEHDKRVGIMINEINKVGQVTQALLEHKVSKQLFHFFDIDKAHNEVTRAAHDRGFHLFSPHISFLFECDVTYMAQPDYSIDIFVHIPMTRSRDNLKLYKLISTPLPINDGKFFIDIENDQEIIAMNDDRTNFKSLTMAELSQCKDMSGTYLCKSDNIVYHNSIFSHSCTGALFNKDHKNILHQCVYNVIPPKDFVRQLSPTRFFTYSHEQQIADKYCKIKVGNNWIQERSIIFLDGFQVLNLDPLCHVVAAHYTFVPQFDLETEGNAISMEFNWLIDSKSLDPVLPDGFSDLLLSISNKTILSGTKKYNELVYEGKAKRFELDSKNLKILSLGSPVATIFIIGICSLIVYFCCCKKVWKSIFQVKFE